MKTSRNSFSWQSGPLLNQRADLWQTCPNWFPTITEARADMLTVTSSRIAYRIVRRNDRTGKITEAAS